MTEKCQTCGCNFETSLPPGVALCQACMRSALDELTRWAHEANRESEPTDRLASALAPLEYYTSEAQIRD